MIQLTKHTPPPLPDGEENTTGYGKYAAWIGLLLPVIFAGVCGGYDLWLKRQQLPSSQTMMVMGFLGIAFVLFLLVGTMCSFVSFLGHGGQRSSGLTVVGVLGVLINAGLLGTGILGGLNAVKARTGGDLHAAAAEFRQHFKDEYQRKGAVDYDPESTAKFSSALDQFAGTRTTDDARVARALKAFLGEINEPMNGLQQEAKLLIKMKVMDPFQMKTKADLQMRKSAITSFLKHNEEVKSVVADAKTHVRKQLLDAGFDDADADKFVAEFWKGFGPKQTVLLGIRDCDQRMVESMGQALDVFEQHWQTWHRNEQGEFDRLDDQTATDEIFRLKGVAQQAAAEQAELQGDYLKSL